VLLPSQATIQSSCHFFNFACDLDRIESALVI
jgi:hypothetical protein